jgi:hypothetical protein
MIQSHRDFASLPARLPTTVPRGQGVIIGLFCPILSSQVNASVRMRTIIAYFGILNPLPLHENAVCHSGINFVWKRTRNPGNGQTQRPKAWSKSKAKF